MEIHFLIIHEIQRLLSIGDKTNCITLIESSLKIPIEKCEDILNILVPDLNMSKDDEEEYYKKDVEELDSLSKSISMKRGDKDYDLKRLVHVSGYIDDKFRKLTIGVSNLAKNLNQNKDIERYINFLDTVNLKEKSEEISYEEKVKLISQKKQEFLTYHWDISKVTVSDSEKLYNLGIINEKQLSVVKERVEIEKIKEEKQRLITEENILRKHKKFYVDYLLGRIIMDKDKNKLTSLNTIDNNVNEKSNCFIVSTTMGDVNHPVVIDYRRFRDEVLLNSFFGRHFIEFYYKIGPSLSNVIKKNNFLFNISRECVLRIHGMVIKKLKEKE
jgi:hypothetical protein